MMDVSNKEASKSIYKVCVSNTVAREWKNKGGVPHKVASK